MMWRVINRMGNLPWCGPGGSVGIATELRAGRSGIESRWGRDFPGGKVRPGRAADHSPPSSVAVMEEYSYTSTHPLGRNGITLPLTYPGGTTQNMQVFRRLHYHVPNTSTLTTLI